MLLVEVHLCIDISVGGIFNGVGDQVVKTLLKSFEIANEVTRELAAIIVFFEEKRVGGDGQVTFKL